MSLPSLLRQARSAVSDKKYNEAEALYAAIMQYDEMKDNLDIKMRHAFCAEKSGNIEVALNYYQQIVVTYHEQGELAAAEILEKNIAALYDKAEKAITSSPPKTPEDEAAPLSDDALMLELVSMGEKQELYPTEVLCDAGDMPDKIWLIDHGIINVFTPEFKQINTLEPQKGSLVLAGEMGLFTRQRRSATLIAHTSVTYTAVENSKIYERQHRDAAFNRDMQRLLRDRWVEPVLQQHSVFERINDIDRKYLAHSFEHLTLNAGDSLISAHTEHDGAYILQSGCMFLKYDESMKKDEPEAKEMMTGIHPGDLIHLSGLLRGIKPNYHIDAATRVELLHLSRKNFEKFSRQRPWLIQAILRYSRRPAHLQVLHPQDDCLWQANRNIRLRKAC